MFRVFAIVLLAAMPGAALAQRKPAPTPSETRTRYFTAIDGLLDGMADVVLKETWQGKNITSATLDVCYPADRNSPRKDRFVVNLAVNGMALSGTTKSLVDQTPVSVKLTQKPSGESYEFKGQIGIAGAPSDVSSSDNVDVSEREYLDGRPAEDGIVTAPKDFTEVSPEAVVLKVKLDQAAEFFKSLRGQAVEINPSSFVVSCEALRSGVQSLTLAIDPDRAASFVARAKAAPGVTNVGWSSGLLEIDRSIRFDAAEWRDRDRIARDKITAKLASALEGELRAKMASAKWNDASGKLTLIFKRPSQLVSSLDLSDTIEVTALAAPERPGATDKMILWISLPTYGVVDDSAAAKLSLGEGPLVSGEDSDAKAEAAVIDAVARAFKAQRWDADKSAWK